MTASQLTDALFVTLTGFVSSIQIRFSLSTEVLVRVAQGGKEMLIAAFLGAIFTRFVEGCFSGNIDNYGILLFGIGYMI